MSGYSRTRCGGRQQYPDVHEQVVRMLFMIVLFWFSKEFQFDYQHTDNLFCLHYMALERIWQHAKYSYGVSQSLAYNSENLQKTFKMEKCEHFFQMFGFGPKQANNFFFTNQSSA